jgi:DNA-binding HxlR family transcriptional regulator
MTRTDYKEVPTRVDDQLTPLGQSLAKALLPLCDWGWRTYQKSLVCLRSVRQ